MSYCAGSHNTAEPLYLTPPSRQGAAISDPPAVGKAGPRTLSSIFTLISKQHSEHLGCRLETLLSTALTSAARGRGREAGVWGHQEKGHRERGAGREGPLGQPCP